MSLEQGHTFDAPMENRTHCDRYSVAVAISYADFWFNFFSVHERFMSERTGIAGNGSTCGIFPSRSWDENPAVHKTEALEFEIGTEIAVFLNADDMDIQSSGRWDEFRQLIYAKIYIHFNLQRSHTFESRRWKMDCLQQCEAKMSLE